MPKTTIPDGERCAQLNSDGARCLLHRMPYGDGTLCGIHYHQRRRAQAKAPRLMLIGSEPDMREALGDQLQSAGFDVARAATWEAGSDQLDQQGFSLVLVDWPPVPNVPNQIDWTEFA